MAKRLRVNYETGQLIGDCTFINDEPYFIDNGIKRRMAKFICICGKEFIDRIDKIKGGGCRGCGCRKNAIIHGHTVGYKHSSEYMAWSKMKDRCYNKNDNAYFRYGKRGIIVCESWLISFENFIKDMGIKPTSGHSIERIDNNGNYEQSNCRWATKTDQARNRRSNVLVTYNGETHCIREWEDILGFKLGVISNRITRYKWPIERALTEPKRSY